MEIEFIHSDAQILLAIIIAGKEDNGASLENIIGAADFINRAYPMFEEVDGALARLIKGKYIFEKNGFYNPTKKTVDYYKKNSKTRSYVWKDLEKIEKFIGSKPWSNKTDPRKANEQDKYLSRELFDLAGRKLDSQRKKITKQSK